MKIHWSLDTKQQVLTLTPEDDGEKKIVEAMRLGEKFTCHTDDKGNLIFSSTGDASWR